MFYLNYEIKISLLNLPITLSRAAWKWFLPIESAECLAANKAALFNLNKN